jgi:phosphate transport system permease protein
MNRQVERDDIVRPLAIGRSGFDQIMTWIAYGLTLLALLPLGSLVWKILTDGIGQLNWHTLTSGLLAEPTGGISNAIVGTLGIVFLATLMSLPIGVLTAVYLSEFGKQNPISQVIRFTVKIISAVPSIVMGFFAYAVLVIPLGRGSALAGSFALAILMLPMIILATEEALKLVPQHQRSGSAALGATQFQTTFRVVIAAALPGITTAVLLAVARAAGETAPLIFTTQFTQNNPELLGPSPSLSVLIYTFANEPDTAKIQLAWTASLVLLLLVTGLSTGARLLVQHRSTAAR